MARGYLGTKEGLRLKVGSALRMCWKEQWVERPYKKRKLILILLLGTDNAALFLPSLSLCK